MKSKENMRATALMIFLYASKMALSFYPKFGFIKKDEYKVDIRSPPIGRIQK